MTESQHVTSLTHDRHQRTNYQQAEDVQILFTNNTLGKNEEILKILKDTKTITKYVYWRKVSTKYEESLFQKIMKYS